MKELTHKDWMKNPTPREMWVWNNDEEVMVKRYVLYILTDEERKRFCSHPVMTPDHNYIHCAEIEEETKNDFNHI